MLGSKAKSDFDKDDRFSPVGVRAFSRASSTTELEGVDRLNLSGNRMSSGKCKRQMEENSIAPSRPDRTKHPMAESKQGTAHEISVWHRIVWPDRALYDVQVYSSAS